MVWKKKRVVNPAVHKNSQVILAIILLVIIFIVGFLMWQTRADPEPPVDVGTIIVEEVPIETFEKEPEPAFNSSELTAVVNTWVARQSGDASVVLSDLDGTILAESNPAMVFFAASIYKLYVAYEGYLEIDEGIVNPQELYINGYTRAECLDLMIRESDSPCAEKLWNELGKQKLTDTLAGYGITDTNMVALTTTAADAAKMLSRIAQPIGLSVESQNAYMTSMKEQIYRDALNKGFSEEVIIYNKIGFNGQVEYHDVAIAEFVDGRQLIVSVLTENVGTAEIANLGRDIEESVTK